MPALSYRQVLDQYDQSTAGGDQRTLPQYAQDMNDLYGTDMFSEGQRDGWWTRASTRADQYLENSLAGRVSGTVGGWAGSLFGRQEQGEEIGRGLPRSLLNMAPLAAEGAAEILSGGAATPIVAPAVAATLGLAGTGAMFGGHTYAQTGSARNAVISGATAMALPGLAHLGGSLGLAAAGAPLARGLLTDVGEASGAFGRKAVGDFVSSRLASTPGEFLSQYGGSQAAMFAGSAASAKLQNPDESVFSKDFATDFLLGQIPFTAMDVYHGARTLGTKTLIRADGSRVDINGLPTRKQVSTFAKPEEVAPVGKPLEPSIGTPEEQANLQAVLQGHDEIARSDMKSGAEKSAAILGLTRTVDDPKGAAALRAATGSPEVTVKGWTNGTNRLVVDEHNGIQNLPEHKTVFFDPAKVKNFQATLDGEVSFTAPQNTLKPADFPLHRPFRDPNVQELPQQPKPAEKMPFATHDQIEHDPFFTEDKPTAGVSPEDDGRKPAAQLQKVREAAPVTSELKTKAVAMGAPVHVALRIGENIPKSADPILNSIRGAINLDPLGRVVRIGNTDIGEEGRMNERAFLKRTQMPKEFLEAAREMYPEAFSEKGVVNVNALVKGLQERPMVTVRKLGVTTTSEAAQARGRVQHWIDTNKPQAYLDGEGILRENGDPVDITQLPREIQRDLDASQGFEEGAGTESATARFSSVNPYPPEVLRGEKEVAPGERITWAGDLTGQTPTESDPGSGKGYKTRFNSQHYPSKAGENQLFFVRGALHEYAVGAKLPDGTVATKPTKIFEVWEVQSDWAGSARTLEEQRAYEKLSAKFGDLYENNYNTIKLREKGATEEDLKLWEVVQRSKASVNTAPSPLLSRWEPLALTSAVQQARALGADAIALSDAESAMMTEGHDKVAKNTIQPTDTNKTLALKLWGEEGNDVSKELRHAVGRIADGDPVPESYDTFEALKKLGFKFTSEVTQSPGMTAAYDVRGPKTLEKLTGEKGKSVVMAEVHQNAGERPFSGLSTDTRRTANIGDWVIELDNKETGQRITRLYNDKEQAEKSLGKFEGFNSEIRQLTTKDLQPQGSPVFKDVQDNPKVANTARLFSLDRISSGLSADDTLSIKEAVHAHDMAVQREKDAKALAARLRTPEESAENGTKDGVSSRLSKGQSPTQAVEHDNLEQLGKKTDAAMLDQSVQKEVVKRVTEEEARKEKELEAASKDVEYLNSLTPEELAKETKRRTERADKFDSVERTQYAEKAVENESGGRKNLPSREEAEAFRIEHAQTKQRDPDDFEVRNGGPGKFYLVEKLNRKISLDIKDSGGHERVGEQARQDEEELKKDVSAETVEAPSPVSSNTATLQLMKELGEWTPKQYADATDGDVAAAIPVIRDAKAALTATAKHEKATPEQAAALLKVRNVHLKYRSYDLGSEVPPDMELVREMGISHGDYLPAFDWYAKNHPSDYMSSLFLDLKRLAKDMLHSVGWTNDFEPGWHYLPTEGEGLPAQINIPHLPTSRDPGDILGWVGNLAHEITHHITKDLASRTDEAAVAFRKTLDELSAELRKSKIIPKDVRDAIEEARKTNVYSQHADGTIKIQDWFDARVSKKSQEWLGVFYGLLNHDEFVSQVFGDKNFTNLLAMTKRVVNKTFTERLMDRFARAWTTLTGLKAGHENALADVLTKFADYLGKPKDYNTMDLMRDKLISQGVRPDALASRIFTVKNMLKTGSLDESVKGWKRENANELLPATAEYDDPAFTLDLPPLAIRKAVLDLDPELVPAHDDLSLRLSHDLEVVRAVLKETGMEAPEGLAKNVLRVQQMRQGVKQYQRAQVRWDNVNNFDGGTEWRDRIAGRLRGIDTPHPSDPTGNHDLAQELLGLSRPMVATESAADVRARTSIDMMKRGKMSVLKDFLEKNFLLDQHFAQIYRAHAGRHDALQLAMASAFEKAQILATAYGFDPKNPGKVSDAVVKNNVEVTTNPRLNEAASNVHRLANVLQQGGAAAPWTHPDIQALVAHLSSAEREKVKNNYAAVMHRNMVNADVIWPRYFDEMTPKEVGLTIAAREGVLPDSAEAVAQDLYTALKEVRASQTAASGSAKLQQIASTLSPATAVKAIDQTNAAINFAEQHIAFLHTRSQYTSEQRYGKLQAVLLDGKGKSIRVSADDDAALLKLVAKQQAAGARLLFRDEKQPGQFGGTNEAVISQFENMEQQRALRMQAALKDAPADVQAALLEPGSMANELRDSLSSLQPLPGTGRKFSAGRETLNMLEQGDAFFGRQSNWMRHKLARASDALVRLHPEVAGNLELKRFGDQKLEAFLTPDNEWARKLTSATFFYKLAFEFGNTFLEGFQHLTTGMQQLISETGSVGDAAALTAKASKDFWTAKTTGKWASEEQRLAMKWFAEHGHDQASAWNDIHDPDTMSLRLANSSNGVIGKTLAGVDAASKKLSGTVQGYGNRIGLLAGFELARSKGMSFDEATKFAVDSKNLGMYTGGKAQRSGLWRIKTKAVPQLLSSLQTYTQGWFGQMYTDYIRGFSQNRPQGLSRAQIEGSKKAFLYGIAAQATLAGALGLPGVGQGLALLQQASGVDLKGWTRGHLQELFDEDQESGGLITAMAMNGVLAGVSPFDPSNRAAIGVPYIGVTSQKGFDISQLAGAPVATAGDFAKGLFVAASGSRVGWETALPNVLRRPARLAADDWDVRDKRGGLLYALSPGERAMTLLGLPPSRVQRARDVAQAAKNAQDQIVAQKEQMADSLAKVFTEQGPGAVQKRLVELKQEQPELDLTALVKQIAARRVRQVTPYDWRRETNPGAELAGLNVYNPSTVALGRQIEQQTTAALGLRTPPNPHADAEALAVDHLLNTGAAKTEAEAKKMLQRKGRPNRLVIPGL